MTPRPNLEWLRNAARDLLRAFRAGDGTAKARFDTSLPGLAAPRLAHAQTVIAREQGYRSWPDLKAAVEASRNLRAPGPRRAAAVALADALIADAARGDPDVLVRRPGVGRSVILMVRDLLAARPADRDRVVEVYLKGLAHPNPWVRFECAHALDIFGDAACRAPLTDLIDDPVPRVRWMAMHALACDGCKAEPFAADEDLRRRVAERALTDPSIQVRRHAAWMLGTVGGEGALAALRTLLARETDATIRRNAEAALNRCLRAA